MSTAILSTRLVHEQDVVGTRQRARHLAALLGFDTLDQARIATAVSEIARNAFRYAVDGRVEFCLEGKSPPQLLLVRVTDRGPGIADLPAILEGRYHSTTGMGQGIIGARRLVDRFEIDSSSSGTVVMLRKLLPSRAPFVTGNLLAQLTADLASHPPESPVEALWQQNQTMLRTLDTLRARQDELERVNAELEETNRGVVALYAELDEKADHLRRADELKSRFLSNMSHEFRTPLNAIRGLTHVLLQRMDGELTAEQERQVTFIRKATDDLSELVNDLLDLAKVEAGKVVIRPAEFTVDNLFGTLRGMLRPLLVSSQVALVFDDTHGLPTLQTDEAKVSQILRNLLSNALKFTERGEIRVSATLTPAEDAVVFAVADTGTGIAPEDQERIFQEFSQLEHPVQTKVRGTGLGLPLSRRLAQLLGGSLTVTSALGVGSTFHATIPLVYRETTPEPPAIPTGPSDDDLNLPVLTVEDRVEDVLLYEKFLKGSGFRIIPAATLQQARQALRQVRPVAILLDILLRGQDAWGFLGEVKADETTRDIPVLVITAVDDERKGLALGADAYAVKPVQRRWLLERLRSLTDREPLCRVLVIDDDEVARYLLRGMLDDLPCVISEADNGVEGLRRARAERPDAIILDLAMPDLPGEEVLARLKGDPDTGAIPVIVVTSKALDDAQRAALHEHTLAIVSKGTPPEEAKTLIGSALATIGPER